MNETLGETAKPKEVASDRPPPVVESTEPGLLRRELAELAQSRFFWLGLTLKIALSMFCGSHFATRWFAPFVHDFVRNGSNPWETFLGRGEQMAFPYGPAMLLELAPPWLVTRIVDVDPSGHVGLLLLRLPLLFADVVLCLILKRWVRLRAVNVVNVYWLSPIVIYATYIHGQLDLLPTALLCLALHIAFERRLVTAGIAFGIALATKGHLVVALPFAAVFLARRRYPRFGWLKFSVTVVAVTAALYAIPLSSPAFRAMVLGSAEAKKIWAVGIPYGMRGLTLYAAPAALVLALFRFSGYRKINRELTIMFLGVLYIGLVVLVPPQPGWFIWSIPFVAYFAARFSRAGQKALLLVTCAYVLYFFVEDPSTFLEAFDPLLGSGAGERTGNALKEGFPGIFSAHGASIAFTMLFASSALTAFEMYRKGVRSNALYAFRDQSFMMGIGGDSGAGKHTLANDLQSLFGDALSTINGDDDHRWERGHAMWSHYTHLDPRGNLLGAQAESLASLREGGNVAKRHYDHDQGRFTSPLVLKPNDFVAIVGLHPFYLASQRQMLHLKVFVSPPEELRRDWKVARDVAKRGYSPERVIAEMERRSEDSAKYVQPQAQHADLVISHLEKTKDPMAVALKFELSNLLDPLPLFHALSQVSSLTVDWLPDSSLTRDQFVVRGQVSIGQLEILASAAIPNVDEIAITESGWHDGGRGLAQLVVLYATSARLRVHANVPEIAA